MNMKTARRILAGAFVASLVAGVAGRRFIQTKNADAQSIVEADEQLRDAVAALPPAALPAVAAPSRVAMWASPALRRAESEKILMSRLRSRAYVAAPDAR